MLGAGPFQLPLIRKAQAMRYRVAATDGNPHAIGLKVADYPYRVDLKDIEGCIHIARERKVAGAMTVASEVAVRTVAAVAHAMGLPGVTPEAARVATDKSLMRECFERHRVPSAISRKCWSLEEAEAHMRDLGLPIVTKPADNAGSRGVSLVEKSGDLPAAYARALKHSPRGLVLVEDFLPGVEISVEALVYRGTPHILALSDKVRTAPPRLLDTTVLFPSEKPKPIQDRACEVARLAIQATGVDMAAVHIEQIVTPEGPKMVELAARGAGFHVFTGMLPWVTGVDVVAQLINMSVGEAPDVTVTQRRGSVLRFPEVPPGIVRGVAGVEQARQIPGVFDLDVYVKVGDVVHLVTSGSERVGHILAMAETRQHAMDIVCQAERLLQIEVEPSTGEGQRPQQAGSIAMNEMREAVRFDERH